MEYTNTNNLSVYANRFRAEWTNTDIRIRFGEIMYGVPGKHLVIEERVAVTMTWLRAKELRDDLNVFIAKYEEVNGELKDPEVISTKSKSDGLPEETLPELPDENGSDE
jgi:hypothetical protein